jgi:hypothetical protein
MRKLKFDARVGSTDQTVDLYNNSWKYSFAHNFKVHFKRGVMQALANKLDITIGSATPDIPSAQSVIDEFNERMRSSIVKSDTRDRYSEASYHVTQVEYKESFAFYDPKAVAKPPPRPTDSLQTSSSLFCRKCGASLSPDSLFCNKCGTKVV